MEKNDIQRTLEAIWASLLGVEDVQGTDNFLLLGGESLLATMAAVRVKEALGYEPSVRSIFTKSIAEVAEEIGQARQPVGSL